MVKAHSQRFLPALAGVTAILAFLILSSVAVVWANGLRFNSSTGTFEQTVIIAIESYPQDVDVWLDGKLVADRIPNRIRNLLPGHYTLELKKSGFQTWQQSFWLPKGQVGLVTDPALIAVSPLTTISQLPFIPNIFTNFDFGLELNNGELTDRGELITRYSQNPLQVHRFKNMYLYQLGGELRLFIKEGSQDYSIYRSLASDLLPLALSPATWEVIVQDKDEVKVINLNTPKPQ